MIKAILFCCIAILCIPKMIYVKINIFYKMMQPWSIYVIEYILLFIESLFYHKQKKIHDRTSFKCKKEIKKKSDYKEKERVNVRESNWNG